MTLCSLWLRGISQATDVRFSPGSSYAGTETSSVPVAPSGQL